MSEEEKYAIEWFKSSKELIGQSLVLFDENLIIKCGVETYNNFNTILNYIDKLQSKLNTLENKLEEHIKFCEQEASGSLHNEICHIALKFDKGLLNIIKENSMKEEELKEVRKIVKKFDSGNDVTIGDILSTSNWLNDLADEVDKLQKEIEQKNADLTNVYMIGFYDSENKWKTKIKDKIKDLEEATRQLVDEYGDMIENKTIRTLKELLGE